MAMVFDEFASRKDAEDFARVVGKRFSLRATVYDDAIEACNAAVFPFEVLAPVVLVERTLGERERTIQAIAGEFGGTFAGT